MTMTAAMLRRALESRGLAVLDVEVHHDDPNTLVVYLHGLAGQHADGQARVLIATVPSVSTVTDSESSPTIILARIQSTERTGNTDV